VLLWAQNVDNFATLKLCKWASFVRVCASNLTFAFSSFQMSQDELGTREGRNAGDERFRCLACGKHYVHQSSFLRHRNMECGKEPRFQCPYCPKKSKRKSNMAAHIKCKHMQSLHFFWNSCWWPCDR
jgi:uncharacterized Zn-finger protein